METREIPREEWQDFLDRFSRIHENWVVHVEVIGGELGDQEEWHEVPLAGISFEPRGSEAGSIEILIGGSPDRHASHTIRAPRRLYVARDQGTDQALEIEDAEGSTTLVRFQVANLPSRQLISAAPAPSRSR